MLRLLFYGIPTLIFLLGLPLALKLVPPNRFYGFRTPTTFSSPEAWYAINFATGLALLGAGILSGLIVLWLSSGAISLKPEMRYLLGPIIAVALMLLGLVPIVLYAGKY